MKPLADQTFYEILDVPCGASAELIEQAFGKAMQYCGPESLATYTLADGDEAKRLLERVEEAYLTLSDAQLRGAYDAEHGLSAPAPLPVAAPAPAPASAAQAGQLAFAPILDAVRHFPWPGSRPEAEEYDESPRSGAPAAAPPAAQALAQVAAVEPAPSLPAAPAASPGELLEQAAVVLAAQVLELLPHAAALPVASSGEVPEQAAVVSEAAAVELLPPAAALPVASSVEVPEPAAVVLEAETVELLLPATALPPPPVDASAITEGAPAASSPAAEPLTDRAAVAAEAPLELPALEPAVAAPPCPAPAPAPLVQEAGVALGEPVAALREPSEPPSSSAEIEVSLIVRPVVAPEVLAAPSLAAAPEPSLAASEPAAAPSPPEVEEPRPAARSLPRMPDLPPNAVFNGELLRRVREARGISVRELADRTKIGHAHLENIEADRYDALPVPVYMRGFLMLIARELRLDPLKVSKSFLEQVARESGKKSG